VPFAQNLLLVVYYAFLALVVAVMVCRALLIVRHYRTNRRDEEPGERFGEKPVVTVQLPLFNERFVVERLLDTICALDWPHDNVRAGGSRPPIVLSFML